MDNRKKDNFFLEMVLFSREELGSLPDWASINNTFQGGYNMRPHSKSLNAGLEELKIEVGKHNSHAQLNSLRTN